MLMRKSALVIAIISVFASIILFSGCGDKDVNISTTAKGEKSEEYTSDALIDNGRETEKIDGTFNENDSSAEVSNKENSGNYKVNLDEVPQFSNNAYISINNNIPGLTLADRTSLYFEKYAPLDYLGRCGTVTACLGSETMPDYERGEIGSVKPSGWHTIKYDCVDGKYLYNRCHLIGFQLSGENANNRNLITGTRYMNVQGMLPFENMVADYIRETNNHVLYRVTPVFKGEENVARGVQIEALSVEDYGEGICFNVYCYNNQPGVIIDYATGDSCIDKNYKADTTTKNQPTKAQNQDQNVKTYILNTRSLKIHKPSCSYISKMSENNKNEYKGDINDLYDIGYTTCGNCF